jgi:hypothetical protein
MCQKLVELMSVFHNICRTVLQIRTDLYVRWLDSLGGGVFIMISFNRVQNPLNFDSKAYILAKSFTSNKFLEQRD